MPWLETAPMDQRSRFIDAYHAGGFTMTELCARFQVSRRVGYKWVARYDARVGRGWPIGAARPTPALTRCRTRWSRFSARRAANTPTGAQRNSWTGFGPSTRG